MVFQSILFERAEDRTAVLRSQAPDFFIDLNLDQVIDAVTRGKPQYDLRPFYYAPLQDLAAIQYRHEVMQDLENPALFDTIKAFARKMREMREHLTQSKKLYYKYQKEAWFLDAVGIYCDAVKTLAQELAALALQARGWSSFCEYLTAYVRSDGFTALAAETQQLQADLASVNYCILIKGSRVEVRKYGAEKDYSTEVEATFAKFKEGAVKDRKVKFDGGYEMDHVEAQVLDCVAKLYPEIFAHLDAYCVERHDYLDGVLRDFDREIQFYVAYLEHIAPLKQKGLPFCYPQLSSEGKEVSNEQGFDLALANKLIGAEAPVVCNDFYLEGQERILVVTGPNQGGKTTFARTFGQLHYLASLGCPVPGRRARLFLFDQLFTHFEREENIENQHGKLEDDLVRIHEILERATPRSIIILNEIFTSTTVQDALTLSRKIMEKIIELDLLCVWVTFIDELTSFSEKTVSMVGTVRPKNPTVRTFKVVRKPADGLAYAISIAEKYRLTYELLKERIKA